MKHIKTPVTKDITFGYWLLYEPEGSEVARIHIDRLNAKETATEIELALNAFDALVDMGEGVLTRLDLMVQARGTPTEAHYRQEIVDIVGAALALVRGEEPVG